jgi:spore germination protein
MPAMNKLIFTIVMSMLLLLSGCFDNRILEDLGFINLVGYDKSEDEGDHILMSISMPQPSHVAQREREVYSTIAASSKMGRMLLQRKTNKMLVSGQIIAALMGADFAKRGMWDPIDTLLRDPQIGNQVRLVVIEDKARDIIHHDFPDHPRTGEYLQGLVLNEERVGTIPRSNIFSFVRDYYDDGKDPTAIFFGMGKDEVVMKGLALFKDDVYKRGLPIDQARIFTLMHESIRGGTMDFSSRTLEPDREVIIVMGEFVSNRKMKVISADEVSPRVGIEIRVRGYILEYTGHLDLSKKNNQKKLAQEIERYIAEEADKVINVLQEQEVDGLGIGRFVRNKMSYERWKQLDWAKVWPKTRVDVQVKMHIKGVGMTE